MQHDPLAEAGGYRDLVAVACGTKRGVFVGGHTCFKTVGKRMYYVRCECEECNNTKVWSVTEFEAHAGNAQHKKPLKSIRASLPDGASVPLAKWLNEKCGALGSSIQGKRYWVWWPGERRWFRCTVRRWLPEPAVHDVRYDDGDVEQLKWWAERTQPLPPGHDGEYGGGETEEVVAQLLQAASGQAAGASNLCTTGAAEGLVGLAGGPPRQQQPADSVAQRPGPSTQRGTGASGRPEVGSGAGPSQPPGSAPPDDVDLAFVLSKLPSEEHESVRQLFSRYRALQAQEAQWAAEVAEMEERRAQLRQRCEEAEGHAARLAEVQQQAQDCQRGVEEAQAALQASQQCAGLIRQLTQQIEADRDFTEQLRTQAAQGQPELERLRDDVARLRQACASVAASQAPADLRQLLQRAAQHMPGGAPGGAAPAGAGPPAPAFSAMGAN